MIIKDPWGRFTIILLIVIIKNRLTQKKRLTLVLGKKQTDNIFFKIYLCAVYRASLIAHSVKNLPAMQETLVRFLGQEDPLEKEMGTHSSILAWRIPWTEGCLAGHSPRGLQSMESEE